MRWKICRGIEEQIWYTIDGNIKKVYLDYYLNEPMIYIPLYGLDNWVYSDGFESSLLWRIIIHEEKIITREEWLLSWLSQANNQIT